MRKNLSSMNKNQEERKMPGSSSSIANIIIKSEIVSECGWPWHRTYSLLIYDVFRRRGRQIRRQILIDNEQRRRAKSSEKDEKRRNGRPAVDKEDEAGIFIIAPSNNLCGTSQSFHLLLVRACVSTVYRRAAQCRSAMEQSSWFLLIFGPK